MPVVSTKLAEYAHPEMLVNPVWLTSHLADPAIRVVQADEDILLYQRGHIPGAVPLDWQSELQDPLRRDVVSMHNFETLMSRKGIGLDTAVILYGDGCNRYAAYALWVLTLYGHKDVRLLDGGLRRWEMDGLPLDLQAPSYPTVDYRGAEQNLAIRAFRDEVFLQMEAGGPLIDARSPEEYLGEGTDAIQALLHGAQRNGHIPAAMNIPWDTAVRQDDWTFKGLDELRQLYGGEDSIPPNETLITYCHVGERSSHTWFVLKHLLGHKRVKNYDGSWTEWGSMIAAPVER